MLDYKTGKIYCIRSHLTDEVYIGSTTTPLSTRMVSHRTKFKNGIYVSSAEILKHGDAYIELIEEFPCDNKEQLNRREGQVIRSTANCVNKRIEGRTPAERYIDNREAVLAYMKVYNVNNKEAVSAKKKAYYLANRERILKRLKDLRDQIRIDKNTSQNIISPTNIECQQNSQDSEPNSESCVNSPSSL
jgi:hypothetical protein